MNFFESAFYASVGLAVKGKEKIEEAAKKFAEDQKMSVEEGKKFVDDVVKSSEKTKEEISKKIDTAVKSAIDKMGLAYKSEVEQLKTRIDELEAQLKKPKGK